MAATIVVGTNSYVTEAESLTILEEFVHAGAWITTTKRVTSLITAYYDIAHFTLTDPDTGVAVDPLSAPTAVKQAQCLLAFDYSQDPTLAEASGQGGTNTKSAKAGSAAVEFFRPEDKTRFPSLVQKFIGPYISTPSGSIVGSCASGTDGVSEFKEGLFNEQLTEGYK